MHIAVGKLFSMLRKSISKRVCEVTAEFCKLIIICIHAQIKSAMNIVAPHSPTRGGVTLKIILLVLVGITLVTMVTKVGINI